MHRYIYIYIDEHAKSDEMMSKHETQREKYPQTTRI
jgi:hypothetical protein